MNSFTYIGLLAGTLTTISFLPQAVKTWKTKSAHDVSLGMFVIFCTGVFLWIVYGILIRDLPVVVTNSFTLLFAASILFMKLKYE